MLLSPFNWRVIARLNPIASGADNPLLIHFQTFNSGSACGCLAQNAQPAINPFEMLAPDLCARIEEWDN